MITLMATPVSLTKWGDIQMRERCGTDIVRMVLVMLSRPEK